MSRTIRRDNQDKPISENQRKKTCYRCRCNWCMNSKKKKYIDEILKREMVLTG